MSNLPNNISPKLRELLQAQLQLFAQFLLLTKEQSQIIAAGDTDALLQSLEQRQQLIGQLETMLTELKPLWQEYSAAADDSSINDLQAQISRILQETTEIDEKNQLAIREQMDVLRTEMRRVGETRRGMETYIKGAEIFSAEFFDQRQ